MKQNEKKEPKKQNKANGMNSIHLTHTRLEMIEFAEKFHVQKKENKISGKIRKSAVCGSQRILRHASLGKMFLETDASRY